jgi:hypothetical protein
MHTYRLEEEYPRQVWVIQQTLKRDGIWKILSVGNRYVALLILLDLLFHEHRHTNLENLAMGYLGSVFLEQMFFHTTDTDTFSFHFLNIQIVSLSLCNLDS